MTEIFFNTLVDNTRPVAQRYFAVFQLKNQGTIQAYKSMMNAYKYCGNSILLKHQLLYALGQLETKQYNVIKDFLIEKVVDQNQNNLSRHEAAEALANYFDQSIMQLYKKYQHSECKQLAYTCQIALQKLRHPELKQQYGLQYNRTMQPAAPFNQNQFNEFLLNNNLKQMFEKQSYIGLLTNQKITLFQKYRIMYYMRNKKRKLQIKSLCQLLTKQYYKTQTSLLKHEICFIIGQIGCEQCQQMIRQCIENQQQQDIVRHQALAAVASQSKDQQYLDKFVNQKYPQLIRESAQVAKYSIKYWKQ